MNQPDRYERFVLPEHKKKLEYAADTKLENAGTYAVEREDHTLGNLVRMQMHRDPAVLFSGYRIPHPLEPRMLIKVQTTGAKAPQTAFTDALACLQTEVGNLRDKMMQEFDRAEREAAAAAAAEAGQDIGGGGAGGGGGGMY